jgi:hypothetical protein
LCFCPLLPLLAALPYLTFAAACFVVHCPCHSLS